LAEKKSRLKSLQNWFPTWNFLSDTISQKCPFKEVAAKAVRSSLMFSRLSLPLSQISPVENVTAKKK
jgi:hypothetical protein